MYTFVTYRTASERHSKTSYDTPYCTTCCKSVLFFIGTLSHAVLLAALRAWRAQTGTQSRCAAVSVITREIRSENALRVHGLSLVDAGGLWRRVPRIDLPTRVASQKKSARKVNLKQTDALRLGHTPDQLLVTVVYSVVVCSLAQPGPGGGAGAGDSEEDRRLSPFSGWS